MAKLPAAPPPAPADGAPASARTAWWIFGPPIVVAGLYQLLRTMAEAWPALHRLRAAPVVDAGAEPDALTALWQATGWPILAMALAVAVVALSRRRLRAFGSAGLRRLALPLWVALCGLAGVALLINHLNLAWREPLPEVEATVLRARLEMPSTRGPGGLQLVLAWPGAEGPQRGLLEGENLHTLLPGRTVPVQRVAGHFWGEYLSGVADMGPPAVDAQAR